MNKFIWIIGLSTALIGCQNNQKLETTLQPTPPTTSPAPGSKTAPIAAEVKPLPTGAAQIISGNSFRNGSTLVSFAQDGTYVYSKNGFSIRTKWTANGDTVCLVFRKKSCSKFKQRDGGRYGWSFNGRAENSYVKVAGDPIAAISRFKSSDEFMSPDAASKFLTARPYKMPNRRKLTMSSGNKLTITRPGSRYSAKLKTKNGKLCGNFEIGREVCLSVGTNNTRNFLIMEEAEIVRRYLLI